jgi:hypothetical protein
LHRLPTSDLPALDATATTAPSPSKNSAKRAKMAEKSDKSNKLKARLPRGRAVHKELAKHGLTKTDFVIPDHRAAVNPQSITLRRDYGFRAPRFARPRNDGKTSLEIFLRLDCS